MIPGAKYRERGTHRGGDDEARPVAAPVERCGSTCEPAEQGENKAMSEKADNGFEPEIIAFCCEH